MRLNEIELKFGTVRIKIKLMEYIYNRRFVVGCHYGPFSLK